MSKIFNVTEGLILKNALFLSDSGFKEGNVFIKNNKVSILPSIQEINEDLFEIHDVKGKLILPSLVDLHVHLREPGYSYKETIKTGTKAAAAGGFTIVCSMPNLNPAPDNLINLKRQLEIINKDACINVIPFATITASRSGNRLVDYKALAPYVAGFTDDGSGVQDAGIMKEAMKEIEATGKFLAAHCEVDSLIDGGYIHKGEYARLHSHKGICSESEWKEVERDIRLAEETGCRLHICHVSTKESVDLIRKAKAKGVKVTCETGPHYLSFSDSDLKENGNFKMNPPIRSIEDRDALREGVADGTIDVIATDHAPHADHEKNKGLERSAMGVVGLETAFSAVFTTMVYSGLMPFSRLIEVMIINPRKILGLPVNYIVEGAPADLIAVDLNADFLVDPNNFFSMGKSTPYDGLTLKSKILLTIYQGKTVFNSL